MRDSYTNPSETKQTFMTFFSCKTNPQNESYENCVIKRIHETNLMKIASQNESTKRILWKLRHETNPQNESFENQKDSRILNFHLKYVYVVKIRQDLLDSLKSVTKRIHETNLMKIASRNESTKRIHETNLMKIASRNESTKRIFWKLEGFGFVNPDLRVTNPCFY
jgi:hypothetical protein